MPLISLFFNIMSMGRSYNRGVSYHVEDLNVSVTILALKDPSHNFVGKNYLSETRPGVIFKKHITIILRWLFEP